MAEPEVHEEQPVLLVLQHVNHELFVVEGCRAPFEYEGAGGPATQQFVDAVGHVLNRGGTPQDMVGWTPAVGDPEPLRDLVLRFTALSWAGLDEQTARLERLLTQLSVQGGLLPERLEYQLAVFRGSARTPAAIAAADPDELTSLLMTWGRDAATRFFFDSDWTCVRSFLEPAARPLTTYWNEAETEILYTPPAGARTLLERALYGTGPIPRLAGGQPLWDDPSGYGNAYSTPAEVREISAFLSGVEVDVSASERERAVWSLLQEAYASAAGEGFGVSIEREEC